jgi:hypothetical protein
VYLPSMLLGGSSILHLLAGHPRLVAFFGIATAASMILFPPFASQPVPGTAQYVQTLEQQLLADESVDPAAIDRARASALALRQATPNRLRAIVDDTLRACGDGCRGLYTEKVMQDATLLGDALLIHELSVASQVATRAGTAPNKGTQ